MSWFDEQIRERKRKDNEDFSESIDAIVSVITRRRQKNLTDDRQKTKNAIDEVMHYYHLKSRDIPESVRKLDDQLEYICRPCGIMLRNVILEPGWYKDAAGAMLMPAVYALENKTNISSSPVKYDICLENPLSAILFSALASVEAGNITLCGKSGFTDNVKKYFAENYGVKFR